MRGRMKGLLTVLGLAVVLLVTGGIVVANHGGIPMDNSADPIQGCFENQNPAETKGALRIVSDNTADCKQNETPIEWLEAVPGPTGPAGPVSGWEIVDVTHPVTSDIVKSTTAICPFPKKVVGGGARVQNSVGSIQGVLIGSFPTGSGNGWIVETVNASNPRAFAICANVAP